MENIKKLEETIKEFVSDVKRLQKAGDIQEVNEVERLAVRKLQLIVVEAEMAGRDLYAAKQNRVKELES